MAVWDWRMQKDLPAVTILDRATGEKVNIVGVFYVDTDKGLLMHYVKAPDGTWRLDKKNRPVERTRKGSYLLLWENGPPKKLGEDY